MVAGIETYRQRRSDASVSDSAHIVVNHQCAKWGGYAAISRNVRALIITDILQVQQSSDNAQGKECP